MAAFRPKSVLGDRMKSADANIAALTSGATEVIQAAVRNPGGPDLATLFAGADVGLALFDHDLRLVACNELYRTLCGYHAQEVAVGTPLKSLIRLSLERQNTRPQDIEVTTAAAIARLQPGTSLSFRYTSPSARSLEVRRRRLSTGAVVETVREYEAGFGGSDLNSQFAQIAEAARARMMHALDVMADGFALFDPQDRLVVYNRKYVDYSPHIADLILPGAQYEDLLREAIGRGGYVLNGMSAEAYLVHRLQQHHNPGAPVEAQLADGRWILINEMRTVDGGIVKTRSDITQMKLREFDLLRISRELHLKNAQFDVALNNMIQGLCMFDSEQRLIVCNRRYLEMYGFSPDVVKPGIRLYDIMRYSVSLGNYTQDEGDRALAERPDPTKLRHRVTIKQRLKDGRVIAVMNEPMMDGCTIATYQDITETENYAEQMREYTQKLERSNRELQDFAYVASHDLQEPLRKIEAFGDRLTVRYGKDLPEDGQMFLDRMQNAAGRMRRLINDLLDYSRVTTKAKPFTTVDLNDILAGVLSDLQIRIDEAGGKVIAQELPKIDADATQMRQLLQNLLANALKFRKPDCSPIVTVTAEMVMQPALTGQPQRTLILKIADNGIGFDNRYKDQIFTIFQRLHGRLEYEGTGVGLATVRKIVERHKGEIDADGRPGEGATFTVKLPARHNADEQTQVLVGR